MRQPKKIFIALLSCIATSVGAATPTAAQLAQFQSLSKVQQEALAKQYGVDLSAINSSATTSVATPQPVPVLEPTSPAKTNVKGASASVSNGGVKLFGYDVINSNSLDLSLVDNLPVPLDYQMGPGDSVRVQIYGKTEQNLLLTIGREGQVNLPGAGPLAVAGQTFEQMRQQITNEIKRKSIGVDVSVAMGSMRTMQVYIVGEATQPGAYNVNGLTTITQALIASGGIKQSGSLRHIQLLRKGKQVAQFDLYDLLLKGDTSKDIRLAAGDTLFVPIKESAVAITGEVARPAVYELNPTETIASLLEKAGGVTPEAYLSHVVVTRPTAQGMQLFNLDLANVQNLKFELQNGDKISLPAASKTLKNTVVIRGEVVRQGALSFKSGMRISDALGSIEEGLTPTSELDYALLVRETNATQDIEVYQVNLLNALVSPGSEADLILQQKDQLFVFDNGLDQNYWLNSYRNSKAGSSIGSNQQVTRETLDQETGAVVETSEVTTIKTSGTETLTKGTGTQKNSREALLKPIVDRLKEQVEFGQAAKLIEITGAVKFPGVYPLTVNMDINALVAAAGGLTERAYLPSAELTRQQVSLERASVNLINFSLQHAIEGSAPLALQPQDHINIKTQPGWQESMVVELQGEFLFPGKYTFKRGETISDVIERAGGFTEYAYPEGAVFSRERLKRQEQERLKMLNSQLKHEISNLALRRQSPTAAYTTDPAQAIALVDQLDNAQAVGRLVVDLQEAVKGNEISNLLLEKGDKIFVPALNPVISIVGEVQYASNHTYNPSLTVEDYIASAGGTKRQADTSRIYIVKANGSVELPNNSFWFSRNYKPLEPGDTIIVPINTDYLDGLSTVSTATQILYQIGVAWSAVKD